MDRTLPAILKWLVISIIVLALAAGMFAAGFGSAYLLTERGQGLSASPTPPVQPTASPSPSIEADEPEPTPEPTRTPLPIPTPQNEAEETFQLFWEVWNLVQRHYYDELPDLQEITYSAIRGMLDTLDDKYTAFIEPDIAAIL